MNSDDGFLSHLGLQLDCVNSVEQQNLYNSMPPKKAKRAGIDPPRPVLSILNEFIDEKLCRALQDHNITRALEGLRDLRYVLRALVSIGRTDLKPILGTVEDGCARFVEMMRQHLVEEYRDPTTPKEDLQIINATLVEIIECGHWPTWQEDVASWGSPTAPRKAS
jgi:hypothetical protein